MVLPPSFSRKMGEIETVEAEKIGWIYLPRGTFYPTLPYLDRFATFFRTSPASLRNVRREKEKVEQIYLPNNSMTSLPDNSANKSLTRPLQSTFIRIPTSSCTNTARSCEGIGVGDAAQWYGNVAALVFPRPPHAAAWVFSGTEAPD